jgi:hypothetical protein
MKEIWKKIEYLPFYEISNLGRVRSLSRIINYSDGRIRKHTGKVLATTFDVDGYANNALTIAQAKKKTFKIHRLVAECFLPRINGKNIVNHKNGIKHDNVVTNLEWVTPAENVRHAYSIGLKVGRPITKRDAKGRICS